jgi:aryl-alcohol dehydrogenase-like predicted oxidoreductase
VSAEAADRGSRGAPVSSPPATVKPSKAETRYPPIMTAPAPRRSLGRTDIRVTPIGLGTWQFSEGKGGATGSWAPIAGPATDAIVRAALDGGMTWFDTAELYGWGRSERALARGLLAAGKSKGDVVVATKWYPLFRRARSLAGTIGGRLEALRPFAIDLHQVHFPGSLSSIDEQMAVMAKLVEAGLIRAVGVSNFGARQMRRAHRALAARGLSLASNQVKFNALDRRIERNGVLDAARELGITIIAYSPLEMGLLTGKFHRDPSVLAGRPLVRRLRLRREIETSRRLVGTLERIAAAHGVTASQVALNWAVTVHGDTVVAIPGASKVEHARESAGAMGFTLGADEMKEIDAASRAAS